MFRKFLPLLLSVLLLFSLTACGTSEDDTKNDALNSNNYRADHMPVIENDGIKAACFLNGQAFYISRSYTDRWDTVYAVDADGVAAPVP